jgi:hypothetical protein
MSPRDRGIASTPPECGAPPSIAPPILVPRVLHVATEAATPSAATERLAPAESAPEISIADPLDSALVSGNGLLFRWNALGTEATYSLAVQDSAGGIVWSATTSDTSAALAPDVTLVRGGSYYWSVSAQLADGRSAKSRMHRFVVK